MDKINARIVTGTTYKFQVMETQIVDKDTVYETAIDPMFDTRHQAMARASEIEGEWYIRIIGIVAESKGMRDARQARVEASLGINPKPETVLS